MVQEASAAEDSAVVDEDADTVEVETGEEVNAAEDSAVAEVAGEAEEAAEAVEEDTYLKHISANPDIINKITSHGLRGSSPSNTNKVHKEVKDLASNNNHTNRIITKDMRLWRCRETFNRDGGGRSDPGVEESLQLHHEPDLLQHGDER